jgi:hypothetical protein
MKLRQVPHTNYRYILPLREALHEEIAWQPVEFTIPAYVLIHTGTFKAVKTTRGGIQRLRAKYRGLLLLASPSYEAGRDSVSIPLLSSETTSVLWYTGNEWPYPSGTCVMQPNTAKAYEIYIALSRWHTDYITGTARELVQYFCMSMDAVTRCKSAAEKLQLATTTVPTVAAAVL